MRFDPTDRKDVRSAIVERLKQRLTTPKGWTQRSDARAADGRPVSWKDGDAISFCLRGAVLRSAADLGLEAAYMAVPTNEVMRELEALVPDGRLMPWNDDHRRTHLDVVSLLGRVPD